MKNFLDTSVLAAAFQEEHPNHKASLALFASLHKKDSATAAHNLAEVYAFVTGVPGKYRATGAEALLYLSQIRERTQIFILEETEYWKTIESFATLGFSGGAVYDALIAQCALKAKAKTIFTWNVKDFVRLGPEIAARVRTPEQI